MKSPTNNMVCFCFTFLSFVGPCLATAHQGADSAQTVGNLVEASLAWAKGRLSTPGVSAEIREVVRTNDQGHLKVKYNVFLRGAPKDSVYTLMQWPINSQGPSEQLHGLTLSADGLVICAGRTPEQCGSYEKKDDPVNLVFSPGKGELFRLALISTEGNTKVFFAIIPDPIIKKDKVCNLEVVRLMPNFQLAMIWGKGFEPNEDLQFSSKSSDEHQEAQVKADGGGEYVSALMPFVKNRRSGKTDLKLKSATCAPALSFAWGD